jgi:hypothetical protein
MVNRITNPAWATAAPMSASISSVWLVIAGLGSPFFQRRSVMPRCPRRSSP